MSPAVARLAWKMAAAETGGGIIFVVDGIPATDPAAEQVLHTIRNVVTTDAAVLPLCMTTNGVGLEEDFLAYADKRGLAINLFWSEAEWVPDLRERALRLLAYQPYAPVTLIVSPENLPRYAENIKMLYDIGFRYLHVWFEPGADWTEAHLPQLKRQYRSLASFYREKLRREEKLFFAPFDQKIADRIRRRKARCALGQYQITVSPDGRLYPCHALLEAPYCIGDVTHGIDEDKRQKLLLRNEQESPVCNDCALRLRCAHHCACINKCATGSITDPSPFQCAHERILIPLADSLAERLYHERNPLFMQQHYNDLYPLLSLLDEK